MAHNSLTSMDRQKQELRCDLRHSSHRRHINARFRSCGICPDSASKRGSVSKLGPIVAWRLYKIAHCCQQDYASTQAVPFHFFDTRGVAGIGLAAVELSRTSAARKPSW